MLLQTYLLCHWLSSLSWLILRFLFLPPDPLPHLWPCACYLLWLSPRIHSFSDHILFPALLISCLRYFGSFNSDLSKGKRINQEKRSKQIDDLLKLNCSFSLLHRLSPPWVFLFKKKRNDDCLRIKNLHLWVPVFLSFFFFPLLWMYKEDNLES